MTSNHAITCFQDAIDAHDEEEASDKDIANVFFDLANSPLISYRFNAYGDDVIVVRQDIGACGQHTGGIVWETAYLLLNYLRSLRLSCRNFLEVGAGCGLVGLGVHRAKEISISDQVILTETKPVVRNLMQNFKRNHSRASNAKDDDVSLRVCQLDWTCFRQDCESANIQAHSIDTIVGTDVVFAIALVEPLLGTLRYLAHGESQIFLCLQERCKDSHHLLLNKAKDHGLNVEDISEQVTTIPNCEWGKDMECCVLKLTVIPSKKKKKRKRT